MAARALGAGQVLAVEPNPNRAARANELGVDEVLPVGPDLVGAVLDLTDGVGVDAAIECSGTEAGFNTGVEAVKAKGTVVQAGLHTGRASVDPMQWCLKDLHIEATWAYPVQVWPRVGRLVSTGRLPVERVVTSEIGIDDVVEKGFDQLIDPAGGDRRCSSPPPPCDVRDAGAPRSIGESAGWPDERGHRVRLSASLSAITGLAGPRRRSEAAGGFRGPAYGAPVRHKLAPSQVWDTMTSRAPVSRPVSATSARRSPTPTGPAHPNP